jgi:hypothetical protein
VSGSDVVAERVVCLVPAALTDDPRTATLRARVFASVRYRLDADADESVAEVRDDTGALLGHRVTLGRLPAPDPLVVDGRD